MPAVMLDTWRPSECPIHGPVHAIWLDGHYGRWSAFHERTRYTCVRFDEAGKRHTHRFRPPVAGRNPSEYGLPGSGAEEPAWVDPPVAAVELSRETEALDGSTFTIPEIARLLISVGEGRSLRSCAHDLRQEAQRRHCPPSSGKARQKLVARQGDLPPMSGSDRDARPVRPPLRSSVGPPSPSTADGFNYSSPKLLRRIDASRSASTAMDYVDQYGPVVLGNVAPERWPVYVAIGALALPERYGSGGRDATAGDATAGDATACRGSTGGVVMVAADCELPGRGYAFYARLGGGRDKDSWIDFLGSLSGAPAWVVADRDDGLADAVAESWPDTALFICENALRDELRGAARRDHVPEQRPERGPVFDEIRGAFKDTSHWQEFVATAGRLSSSRSRNLRGWMDDHESLVMSQFRLKSRHRNAPTNARSLDLATAEIQEKLLQRGGVIRNLWRFNLRLALMAAHWSELDREGEYVADLTRHFACSTGPTRARRKAVRPDWASGRDFGGARSIDDFLVAAETRRREAEVARVERQRVAARLAEFQAGLAGQMHIESELAEGRIGPFGRVPEATAPRRASAGRRSGRAVAERVTVRG